MRYVGKHGTAHGIRSTGGGLVAFTLAFTRAGLVIFAVAFVAAAFAQYVGPTP